MHLLTKQREYHSEPNLITTQIQPPFRSAKSEPILSHPLLLNDIEPPNCSQLHLAAETLDNIVCDATLLITAKKSPSLDEAARVSGDRVLRIGTI